MIMPAQYPRSSPSGVYPVVDLSGLDQVRRVLETMTVRDEIERQGFEGGPPIAYPVEVVLRRPRPELGVRAFGSEPSGFVYLAIPTGCGKGGWKQPASVEARIPCLGMTMEVRAGLSRLRLPVSSSFGGPRHEWLELVALHAEPGAPAITYVPATVGGRRLAKRVLASRRERERRLGGRR